MQKKLIFFISLITFLNLTLILSAEIIPKKKPIQSKEEKEQKLLIDVLKPLPKPITEKIIKEEEKKSEEKVVQKKGKNLGVILPKKKPIIAGSKVTKTVKKSKYYNKKDFEIAKKATVLSKCIG